MEEYFPRELCVIICDYAKYSDEEKLAWLFEQSDFVIKTAMNSWHEPFTVYIDDGSTGVELSVSPKDMRAMITDDQRNYVAGAKCTLEDLTPAGCRALITKICAKSDLIADFIDAFCLRYQQFMRQQLDALVLDPQAVPDNMRQFL